jgi:hypothetical protein
MFGKSWLVNNIEDSFPFVRGETSFHPMKGGGVLFNAKQGRLYALNAAAGFTWLCIKDGCSEPQTTRHLADAFGVDMTVAAEWLQTSMEIFNGVGLLEIATQATSDTGPIEKTSATLSRPRSQRRSTVQHGPRTGIEYRLFDESVWIAAPSDLQPAIDSLLGSLRARGADQGGLSGFEIDIIHHDELWTIAVDGQCASQCQTGAVVSELERLLVQSIVPATRHLLTFHAAITQRNCQSYLLAGQSRAGKTTLSVALARFGWSFGSDEIVLLGHDLDLRALPLPACIKEDTFSLVETWFPQLRTTTAHTRYGETVKYLAIKSHLLASGPGYVIFPHFDPEGANKMQPLDTFTGLQTLLAHCVFVPSGFQHKDVKRVLEWNSVQRYFDLFFNDCHAAVALLSGIGAVQVDLD